MGTSEFVCLKCGTYKNGSWKTCPDCKHKPKEHEDMAKHLLLSHHYLNSEQLKEYSQCIKQGNPVGFEPTLLKMVLKVIDEKEAARKETKKWVLKIYGSIFVIFLLVFFAWIFR